MHNLDNKAKQDNRVMSALKVNEISHVIAYTDKGPLTIRLKKGESGKDYKFVLDAVPQEDKVNKELMDLLGNRVLESI